MTQLPCNLEPCDPNDRFFPIAWKEAYYRRHYDNIKGGYVCPDCKNVFSGVNGFRMLHGDHIVPYTQGGLTVWDNFTLRCGRCNIDKSDKLTYSN